MATADTGSFRALVDLADDSIPVHAGPARVMNPAGYFCLRTPLLPFQTLVDWSGIAASEGDRAVALRTALREIVDRPEVREAIFLASPALDEAIPVWRADPLSDHGHRLERSLVKYLARMTTRCTPFGLFAGIGLGTVARATQLCVAAPSETRRHTRLDNEFLFAVARAVAGTPEARAALRYFPNDSLSLTAGQGHYAETRPSKEGHSFHLVAVEGNEALNGVLARAAGGATRDELAATLVDGEHSFEETIRFVEELIDSQLLVPDLDLRVTGPEPGQTLAAELERLPGAAPVAALIRSVDQQLQQLDAAGLGHDPEEYRRLARVLEPLPAKIEISRLFQVDLVRPNAGTIGPVLVDDIRRGVELLQRITRRPLEDDLLRFRQAFEERYEGREVPLLEALDQERGVGASLWPATDPSPLLRDLPLDRSVPVPLRWEAREGHLLHRLSELARAGAAEWVLTPDDIERLTEPDPAPLPASFSVLATLEGESAHAVECGDYLLYLRGIDSPGTRMLGRFCHADAALAERVAAQHRIEEALDPDAIFAELVHLPAGRLGNILLRPTLREHEITYLGSSGASRDRQIPASDLRLRVRDGRIELWSARLGRRVLPRLSSAHNYSHGLLPYRFLCQLQTQGQVAGGSWQWHPLGEAAFLPRVRLGRLILSLATWRLDRATIHQLTHGTPTARLDALAQWRTRAGAPRWVSLIDGDNQLAIDLENPLAAECLLHELSGSEEARLQELWPSPDRLLAEGPGGRYTHELLVPFVAAESARPATAGGDAVAAGARRRFPPGSEWLFFKLYSGTAADRLLVELVSPMSREWLGQGRIDRWFFIRYADPEPHLRWRLHVAPGELAGVRAEVESRIERLVANGVLWRVQVDTYEREVERYGGVEGMVLAERLFQIDSELVLELLDLFDPGDAGLDERWRVALVSVDRLFDAFGLSPSEKLAELGRSRRYGTIATPDAPLRRQLSERFRELRSEIGALLRWNGDEAHPLAPGLQLLAERSGAIAPIVARYRELAEKGTLTSPLGTIAGSMVHMHLNRLLRGAPNAHETVLYDFLQRFYQSDAARRGAAGRNDRPQSRGL